MKKHYSSFCFSLLVLLFVTSCNKNEIESDVLEDNDFIKSEVLGNNIVSRYKYNSEDKIAEVEGLYFYSRYSYDNENRLIKIETAADPLLASSSYHPDRTELMTAKNSTISGYRVFNYDENGRLIEIENYFKRSDGFVFTSKNSLDYLDGKILKVNLHNNNGEITQFTEYEYDNRGNVSSENYYSYLFTESEQPKLIQQTSFTYDDKNNPFRVFAELGNPGLYTNPNNIIATSTILYEIVDGIDSTSESTISYEYNNMDYPVRVITENSEYEYRY